MTATSTTPARIAPKFPWTGLIALATATFLSVTSEMIPTGLLPDMSASLGVSEAQIGLLVTVFAFTVVVTSAPLTALTRRWPRHGLLIGILVVLGISNALTAIAPDYAFVVGSRVLGGVAHGMFWSIVGAYAGHLVPKEQIGRAVSITLGGGTLAFVLGVPLGTFAGHVFGWRLSFGLLAALMMVGALVIWKFLPAVEREADGKRRRERDRTVPRPRDRTIPLVIMVCVIAAVTMVGHYAFYTFVVPFLTGPMGVPSGDVGALLFLYGIAGAGGLILAGSVFGPRPQLGLILALVVTGIAVAALAVLAGQIVLALIAFILWGLAFGALPPLLQTRMLHTSSPAFRDTASALYTTSFNVGIGGGALVGAVIYDAGGLMVLPWAYVGLLVVSVALVLVVGRMSRTVVATH
ncbi:Predicted arabinose efflux permease, MFS family [Leifsonia sp. 98AMF]|uniref:MFS transporter n=1 Tax=Microbacteriaceae TaxID=85023 RepID=UPI00037FFC90|nr:MULTISPECIES: MFS transporter [Microbacteriaceae]SDH54880.1 Predicted arabinose efflux permease, MFS family [Leifsonia sp. 197AMF]SDI83803.1 Predicted arabinose efflux permease, MFS family [Leifsonia sp. 466MF]SDJ99565.1 Predicted arabinose efflux permease, MFS family [Leifsonia sp. 157MF]SDN87076.1 Predicted arabinose efflux permease, MFS family [Leifsonia sp. 509MF]SEN19054.1 Predicted arabinose efflux permease, MFS family [Leifsonia sp. 467MF]